MSTVTNETFNKGLADLLEQEYENSQKRLAGKGDPASDGPRIKKEPQDEDYDRYYAEREENNARRSRKIKTEPEDEIMKSAASSANGSPKSSRRRSRSPRGGRHDRDRDTYRDRRDDRHYRPGGRLPPPDDSERYYRPGRSPPRFQEDDRPRSRGMLDSREISDRRDPAYRREITDHRDPAYRREITDRRDPAYRRDDRDRDRDRRRRSPPARKVKTPEPTDDERDRRTVFVQQLAARLRTKELQHFFEQVGPVVEAQIVKDRVSGRSKGVGYVEFRDEDSVQKAIQLTGQKLLGIPIIAQLTEAEKNRQARNTEGTATQSNGIPFHRLYVGNIHFSITEEDLKNVFEPFGELEFVQLQKEEQGRSKGYGFVQFIDPAQAKEALEKMNGFELAGRPIRVGLGNDKFTPETTQSLLQRFGSQQQQANHHNQGSSFSGAGGRGAHAGGTGNFDRASGRDQEKAGGASALDDTDVSGVNFSNYSRDALMRKLARIDEPEKVAPKLHQKKAAPVSQPISSRCVLLKNMYNVAEETDPNWQQELEEDVKAECEDKYGQVVHLALALDNNDGEIYIKFDRVQGGENAIRGLNGRFFGGRTITASYIVEAVYNVAFPKAANV
ncbi:splicing factor, CC1-like protein [Teratosphaeria destructans]|uniref:Splicing factor, CC1-like protein n=1 Tax=Teratosphaeria destructans TaxID=418781 RepID=A0A9W7SZP5_9PEZI|nr:splicing factor, CC1-like protein [Teratosphaeria destructans]